RAVGTPSYMAPEQAQALPYDQRADIYALGLVLFEMFTGSVAFAGDTPIAVALQQMVEAPRNPRDVEHTVPEHSERAILRCLEKDPEKRFSSVKELKAALVADAATAQQSVPAWRSFSRIHVVDPIKALAGNRRGLLTTLGLVVVLTALFTAGIAFDRTTKNTEELASFQNAQSVDTEAAWNEFLKNHREGQLSVAAQERLNKLRIRAQERSRAAAAATLPASAVTTPP